ncbi:MAG: ABC transporter permease, partial [Bacteroidales bacterium]|nr:ABC transporter permease [Bacteroidales bacterium]
MKKKLKYAFRFLTRDILFTTINVVGLSVGMAATLLILLYVIHEVQYDKHHLKAENIYRIDMQSGSDPSKRACFTPPPLAPALTDYFPGIRNATRLVLWKSGTMITSGDQSFLEENIARADTSLFDIFTIPFVSGNKATALQNDNSLVLTESMARKYFGKEDPIGKQLVFNQEKSYEVTAIIHDIPVTSHFTFDFLIRGNYEGLDWGDGCLQTYILLENDFPPAELESRLPEFTLRKMGPWIESVTKIPVTDYFNDENNRSSFHLTPLTNAYMDHHLEGIPGLDALMMRFGNQRNLLLFSLLALLILVLAAINFINLSTARSVKRTMEVSLRKAMGASRVRIIDIFLIESVILSILALFLAILLVIVILPWFNAYLNLNITLAFYKPLLLVALLFTLLTGILAGSYPSFSIARVPPATILGKKKGTSFLRSPINNLLLSFQFAISTALIISTIVIYRQQAFMVNADLGFPQENLLVVERASRLKENQPVLAERLASFPSINQVAFATAIPGRHHEPTTYQMEGRPSTEEYFFHTMMADPAYVETMGLQITRGRNLNQTSDPHELEALINEKAVATYEWTNPLGKRIIFETRETADPVYATVVGVVKDFHFQPLHRPLEPMMICQPLYPANLMVVRIDPSDPARTIREIEKQWANLSGGQPFRYGFLEDELRHAYAQDQRTGFLFLLFACLAIVLSCAGMLGLVISVTEQRTREIGIRKVNGARTLQVFRTISGDFLKWIFGAVVLAIPVTFIGMTRFLEQFSNHIPLSWWIFLLAALMVLIIAQLTISWQTFRVASR